MKTLKIQWQHLDIDGETCERCYDTGENLVAEIKRLNRTLNPKGYTVELIEIKLDPAKITESNSLLFNGVLIENILNIEVKSNYCESCSTLVGAKTYCRTVLFDGNEYEDIPAKAIRQAAYKALGLKDETTKKCDCNCGSGGCC